MRLIGIIIVIVILLVALSGAYYWRTTNNTSTQNKTASNNTVISAVDNPSKSEQIIKPRPTKISDCGYGHLTRGWYDFTGQGVKNDYCRFVGGPGPVWFSCHLAGSDVSISPLEVKYDENAPHDPLISGTYGC